MIKISDSEKSTVREYDRKVILRAAEVFKIIRITVYLLYKCDKKHRLIIW